MTSLLISVSGPQDIRVATVANQELKDLDIEQSEFERVDKKSNIYKGVITSIEPSLGAVFIDYGSARHGFLPLKEISREYFLSDTDKELNEIQLHDVLKLGQELVVQIEKEERGNKGAALTTYISLPGAYLVLMPNSPRTGGISRRIEGDERDQLKAVINQLEIPKDMGVIVRTACVGKTFEELNWDLNMLLRYWEAIKQAAVLKPAPYLIHQESDVIIRSVRDYLRQDVEQIVIDDEAAFQRAQSYLQQVRPDYINLLKLHTHDQPLFSFYNIESQIENAFEKEVTLPSGGSLVIDHTEALVSIDVNSARATKGRNISGTAHNVNLEAATEIAKQLRIRDIGGLIVIDFIDMVKTSHQREVEDQLRNALKSDRARIQVGRISRFGLLEMSRQRLRPELIKHTQAVCPHCKGRGTMRSVQSLSTSILHALENEATKTSGSSIQLQAPLDVATYLINEKREQIAHIQEKTNIKVIVIPNQYLDIPDYQIKLIKKAGGRSTASYKQVKPPKVEAPNTQATKGTMQQQEPAINEFLSTPSQAPTTKKSNSDGLMKRLWEIMFGSGQVHTEKKPQVKAKQNTSQKRDNHPQRRSTNRRGSRGGQTKQNNRQADNRTKASEKEQYAKSDNSAASKKQPQQKNRRPQSSTQKDRPSRSTANNQSKNNAPTKGQEKQKSKETPQDRSTANAAPSHTQKKAAPQHGAADTGCKASPTIAATPKETTAKPSQQSTISQPSPTHLTAKNQTEIPTKVAQPDTQPPPKNKEPKLIQVTTKPQSTPPQSTPKTTSDNRNPKPSKQKSKPVPYQGLGHDSSKGSLTQVTTKTKKPAEPQDIKRDDS